MTDFTPQKISLKLVANDKNTYNIIAYSGASDDQLLALSRAIAPLIINGMGTTSGINQTIKVVEGLLEEA